MGRLRVLVAGTAAALLAGSAALPHLGAGGAAGDGAASAAPVATSARGAGPGRTRRRSTSAARRAAWRSRGRGRCAATARPASPRRRGRPARSTGRRSGSPTSPNADHITGQAGERSFQGSVGWYRTSFSRPAATASTRCASSRSTTAPRSGSTASGSATTPASTCRSSSTPRSRPGARHELVVRADWRDPERMKVEGWHRTWFNFGGINREVTIRPLGRQRPQGARRAHAPGAAAPRTSTSACACHNRGRRARHRRPGVAVRATARGYPLASRRSTCPRAATSGCATRVDVPGAGAVGARLPSLYDLRARGPRRGRLQHAHRAARDLAPRRRSCCSTASRSSSAARRSTRTPRAAATR